MANKNFKTVVDLSNLQNSSLECLIAIQQKLIEEREGKIGSVRNRLTAAIGNIQTEINVQRIIKAHIDASKVIVSPITSAEEAELNRLADKVDQAIIAGANVNALIALTTEMIQTAADIGKIMDKHSEKAPA